VDLCSPVACATRTRSDKETCSASGPRIQFAGTSSPKPLFTRRFDRRFRGDIAPTSVERRALSLVISVLAGDHAITTRSLVIAEGPRDASCQLKFCQLPRNSAVRQVLNKSKL